MLTGNADAHLKNLSFRVSDEGIDLAPFYDLVSTECYRASPESQPRWPHRPLSLQIGNANTFGALTPADILSFAADLGTNRRAAARALGELTAGIGPAADSLLGDFERLEIPAAARAAELQVLRQIRLIAIRDMVERLYSPKMFPGA